MKGISFLKYSCIYQVVKSVSNNVISDESAFPALPLSFDWKLFFLYMKLFIQAIGSAAACLKMLQNHDSLPRSQRRLNHVYQDHIVLACVNRLHAKYNSASYHNTSFIQGLSFAHYP